jgi:hypothetical protein
VIGGVDLIRITERAIAIEVHEDHPRRLVGHPCLSKRRFVTHHPLDGGVRRSIPTDSDAQRIAPCGVALVTAWQDDTSTEIDRPLVESRQEP